METKRTGRNSGLWLRCALALLVGLGILIPHAHRYYPFIADDALISLRYARRLIDGFGLTWTAGKAVEGYTNFLWVVANALLGAVGVDLILAARILGGACMTAVLAAGIYAFPPRRWTALPAVLIFVAVFALSGSAAVWTIGGLEQPLVAALLAWAVALALPLVDHPAPGFREGLLPGLPLALLCLARADGALFTVAVAGALLVARRFDRRAFSVAAGLAVLPAALSLAYLAFRLSYYRAWLPNTAYAKLAFTTVRLAAGGRYVWDGLVRLRAVALPLGAAAAICLATGHARRKVSFLLCILAAWCGYVMVIGGDIFPARRHLLAAHLLLAFLAAQGLNLAQGWSATRRLAIYGLLFPLLALFAVDQLGDPQNRRALSERWEFDGEVVGRLLKEGFGPARPLLAVDPAGCVPYFSGLPAIDMLGLNDRYLARHRPANFGRGFLGHELGNGRYILRRRPDLVLLCRPSGSETGCFPSGKELLALPRFRNEYQLVAFAGTVPHRVTSRIWVRKEGGAVGVRREGNTIRIPGYLYYAPELKPVAFDSAGRLALPLAPGEHASFALAIDAGRWRLSVDGGGVQLQAAAGAPGETARAISGNPLSFTRAAGETGLVEVVVANEWAQNGFVVQTILERSPEPPSAP